MRRERALKVVLVLVGLLFLACIYPVVMSFRHPNPVDDTDAMMSSLYVTLGVFLLLAVRNPSANRSLIAFAAWSSLAHGAIMMAQSLHYVSERVGLLSASAAFVVIGVALIALTPAKQSVERTQAA